MNFKRIIAGVIALSVTAVMFIPSKPVFESIANPFEVSAASFDKQQYVAEVVELVNEERARLGLAPLKNIDIMNYMCDIRADELTESFSHTRPDGSRCFTVFKENNIEYYSAGENIAKGQTSPQDVFDTWCNSEGHYANIVDSEYTYIGVSVAEDSEGNLCWVQLFSDMDSSYEGFVTPAPTTTTTTPVIVTPPETVTSTTTTTTTAPVIVTPPETVTSTTTTTTAPVIVTPPETITSTTVTSPQIFDKEKYVAEVVELVNEERARLGLAPLKNIDIMNNMCDIRADELTESFSHTRPDGSSCFTVFKENNIEYYSAGENIAKGQTSPQAVFDTWCNSEGHYANIIDSEYTYIGVSLAEDSEGNLCWVQLFADMDSSYENIQPSESDFEFTGGTITKYLGNDAEVIIPASINGEEVISVGKSAFEGCTEPENVIISEGITSVGYFAFANCSSLKSITIPESVSSIGDNVFYGCFELAEINVSEGNETYCSKDGVLFEKNMERILCCPNGKPVEEYTIPETVTAVGYSSFEGCHLLKNITIPEGVTILESCAFEDCQALESINIPESVASIGNRTFFGCTSLTEAVIPKSVESIGIDAFNECTSLTDIYYAGTEEEWNEIVINEGNEPLAAADIHFLSTGAGLIAGDLNKNGKIDAVDFVLFKKLILEMIDEKYENADMNGDGKVNSTDLVLMKKKIIG